MPTIYGTHFVVLSSVLKKKNPKKYKVHIFFNLFPVYLSFFFFDPLELVLISQSPEGHAES